MSEEKRCEQCWKQEPEVELVEKEFIQNRQLKETRMSEEYTKNQITEFRIRRKCQLATKDWKIEDVKRNIKMFVDITEQLLAHIDKLEGLTASSALELAEKTIAELEESIAELRERLRLQHRLSENLQTLIAEREKELEKYGDHTADCKSRTTPCSCGYEQALDKKKNK